MLSNIKNKLNKVIAFCSSEVKFNTQQLVDNSFIEYLGEVIELGQEVYQIAGNNSNPLPDGAYITKSNVNFTVADGKVISLIPNPVQPVVVPTPVLQAQSAEVEEIPATEAVVEVPEVKLADVTPTVDIVDLVTRISNLEDALGDIQTSLTNLATLYVSQDNYNKTVLDFNKTKQMMKTVAETVELLADQPSAEPVEKEMVQLSSIKVPTDIKESQSYKVMQYAKLVEKV